MSTVALADLLSRFKNLVPPDEEIIIAVQKVISNVLGIEIPTNAISVTQGRIFLQVSPLLRSRVMMKHEQILADLKVELGRDLVQAVR